MTNSQNAVQQAAIPPGWKLVPIEPTESMVVDGFESAPDPCFSKLEDWDAYEEMSGCEQAAHKARLCYAAMLAAAPTPPETWKVLPSPAPSDNHKQFAIVLDRDFSDGLSLAVYDGTHYVFSDGDCFKRDGDTLDGFAAEFLTDCELEQKLSAAAAKPFIPRTPEQMIEFIGSQFGAMQFADEVGGEWPKADVTYTLTVHDLMSAFSMAGFYDVDVEPDLDTVAILAAAKAIDTPHGRITLIHTRDDGTEVPTAVAEQFARALIGGSKP